MAEREVEALMAMAIADMASTLEEEDTGSGIAIACFFACAYTSRRQAFHRSVHLAPCGSPSTSTTLSEESGSHQAHKEAQNPNFEVEEAAKVRVM